MQELPPLLTLTTQQLHYLVTISNAPTWAAAANELGVSPSALSQGLAELERRIGVTLFAREGRRRVLAPGAEEVVAYAERVVAQTRDLGRWAASMRSGSVGRLRLGMIDVAAVDHFPAALGRFRSERPDVDLLLTVAPSSELIEQLRSAELDVVIVVDPPPPTDDLDLTPLLDEDLAVYAPHDATDLVPQAWGPFVLFPEGSHTRSTVVRALRDVGADVAVVAVSHQPEVLRTMVELGLGWTVLPVVQAESGERPLRRARAQPLAQRRIVAARRHDSVTVPAADDLVAALTASALTARTLTASVLTVGAERSQQD